MDRDTIERTKKLTCWHILSVTAAVVSMVLASMLLIANVTFYINEDHMVEVCSSSDESVKYYPCHYLEMLIGLVNNGEVTSDDYRFALHITYLASIVMMTHYLLTTMILMLGVATNKHLALIPKMVVQFLMALVLTGMVLVELYVDHGKLNENADGGDNNAEEPINRSKYFMVAVACLAYAITNWVIDCMTYLRIKKVNKALGELPRHNADQSFSYQRFGTE